MSSGKKLAAAGLVVAGATFYMAYLGASASWQYYLTAEECLADAADLAGSRIRVSGRIATGTLVISPRRDQAEFALEAADRGLKVSCQGTLPDNLAEQIDVVVEGKLETPALVRGDKVLTRCASKYESRHKGETRAGSATVAQRRQETLR
ncbi:MAG: cytochrome c maturation protein CcmE [Pirellulales bacterium]|nr:cytochrome c maturation protein CcmE [Pirellulales bacterium]